MHLIQKITLFFMLVASTLTLPMQRVATRFAPLAHAVAPQLRSAATLSRLSSLLGSQNLAQKAAKPQVLKVSPKFGWQQNNQWQWGKQEDKKQEKPKFGKKPFVVLPPLLGITHYLSVHQPDEDTLIFSIGDEHIDKEHPEISKKHVKDIEEIIALLKSTGLPVFMHIELKDHMKIVIKNNPAHSSLSATMDVVIKHAVNHDMQENNIHYQSFDTRNVYDLYIEHLRNRGFSTFWAMPTFTGYNAYFNAYIDQDVPKNNKLAQSYINQLPISSSMQEMLAKRTHYHFSQSLVILDKMRKGTPINFRDSDILQRSILEVLPDLTLVNNVLQDIAKPGKKIIFINGGSAHLSFLEKILESKNIACVHKQGREHYSKPEEVWKKFSWVKSNPIADFVNMNIYDFRGDRPFTVTPILKPIIEKFQNKK